MAPSAAPVWSNTGIWDWRCRLCLMFRTQIFERHPERLSANSHVSGASRALPDRTTTTGSNHSSPLVCLSRVKFVLLRWCGSLDWMYAGSASRCSSKSVKVQPRLWFRHRGSNKAQINARNLRFRFPNPTRWKLLRYLPNT